MYKDIVKASSNDALMTNKQIEKDLLRIMPANACFSHLHSTGIPRLRRVMRALAWLYPDIGYVQVRIILILLYCDINIHQLICLLFFIVSSYCQGTGTMAASLLLLLEEEDAFWMMATIVEDLLPASYYSSTLLGNIYSAKIKCEILQISEVKPKLY